MEYGQWMDRWVDGWMDGNGPYGPNLHHTMDSIIDHTVSAKSVPMFGRFKFKLKFIKK
jgi:hypothetical protein